MTRDQFAKARFYLAELRFYFATSLFYLVGLRFYLATSLFYLVEPRFYWARSLFYWALPLSISIGSPLRAARRRAVSDGRRFRMTERLFSWVEQRLLAAWRRRSFAKSLLQMPSCPKYSAVGDVNGDHKLDVVVLWGNAAVPPLVMNVAE